MRFLFTELQDAPLIPYAIYEGGANPFSDDPLLKLLKFPGFKRGIGNQSGFRKSNKEDKGRSTSKYAFVVIKDTGKQEEWPNKFIEKDSTYIYYGDNREPGNHYLNTKQQGNKFLEEVFARAYGDVNFRKEIPPIFVFRSTGNSTNIEFLGVAVPGAKNLKLNEALVLKRFTGPEGSFENYEAHFTILPIPQINRTWLRDLKDANKNPLTNAPEQWLNYINDGIDGYPLELSPIPETDIIEKIAFSPNERDYITNIRLTQGKFREKLLVEYDGCNLCGINIKELLVASHIKPWKDSNHQEKIDIFNGFLLCPLHNALFDKGFISFDSNGNILISKKLPKSQLDLLNVKSSMKIKLDVKHIPYLEWHRKRVFISW